MLATCVKDRWLLTGKVFDTLKHVGFQFLNLAIKFGLIKRKWADTVMIITALATITNMRVKEISPYYIVFRLFHRSKDRITPLTVAITNK